ncbi:hypothetical protein W03_09730 [Nitrosomonas sp. PY1]|uniref:PEP-CTERM sorting domain-containing protein n=1 Tax=Nitrosomonas sp. PY1 TaxID=1803906 RepID=UPI001FC7DE70|nr:PEP-CTERM sorting domain-containing protein [Nitrosomonas sp. PY1]GKS68969.1 hypothetical protein W03_09730 [Nitrosomonas sp. PY1]
MKKIITAITMFLISLSANAGSFGFPSYLGAFWSTGFNDGLVSFNTVKGPHEQNFYAPRGDVSFTVDSVDFWISQSGTNPNQSYTIIIDGNEVDWGHVDNFNSSAGEGFFHGTTTVSFDEGGNHTFKIAVHPEINEPAGGWLVFGAARGDVAPVLYGDIPLVPEPSTYAMLITGLLIIAFSVRRKYKNNVALC